MLSITVGMFVFYGEGYFCEYILVSTHFCVWLVSCSIYNVGIAIRIHQSIVNLVKWNMKNEVIVRIWPLENRSVPLVY